MLNRRYENPFTIEDELVDLGQDIADLEERLNFAWQDDEAEAERWE